MTTTDSTTTTARAPGTVPALVGMVPCRAHGGRPGGECYYSLAMDPACGDTPCMIEPGPTVGGVGAYKNRIHPNAEHEPPRERKP
jgi:hypothetical protein